MSSSYREDVYDKIQDFVPLENISNRIIQPDKDKAIDSLKEACNKAVQFLNEDEVNLMFFRYFQGASYKTLKKNISIGSTKTAAKRIRRLSTALRSYILYHQSANYDEDIKFIEDRLGEDSKIMADLLFRRWSRSRIVRKGPIKITRRKLENIIDGIVYLGTHEPSLFHFWEVITAIGKKV